MKNRSLLATALVGLVALTACGSSAEPEMPMPGVISDGAAGSEGQPRVVSPAAPSEERGFDDKAPVADDQRSVIRTASLELEVADLEAASDDVRALADDFEGYVADSSLTEAGERAGFTLRVPSERFDAAVAALRGLAEEVLSANTRSEDVTTAIVDMQARLDNLRAAEVSYRQLLERAGDIEDVLAVQARLDEVRGQIESLDAQLKALSRQAEMSTISVGLQLPAAPVDEQASAYDPGQVAERAVALLIRLGQGALSLGIFAVVIGLPLLLVLLLLLGAVRLVRHGSLRGRREPLRPTE